MMLLLLFDRFNAEWANRHNNARRMECPL